MDDQRPSPAPRPGPREELLELMQELRIAIPSVQVLFAFLLTLPFTNRFADIIDSGRRITYFVAFAAAAVSSVLLMAPSALHRLFHALSDPGGMERLLRLSNKLAIAGTGFLAVAMAAVVYLITDLLFHTVAAALATAGLSALMTWFWFGLPLALRLRSRGVSDGGGR